MTSTDRLPLTREEILAQCDPRFLAALSFGNNGPLPPRNRTLGPAWIRWIETNCRLGEGDLYGKPPRLHAHQQALMWKLGEITDDGRRRFELALLSLGKGSGKSPIGGWIGSVDLAGPSVTCEGCRKCAGGWLPSGNPHAVRRTSPDVINMASSYEQADLILDEIRVTFDLGPLAEHAKTMKGLVELRGERGKARRIPATPKKADGTKATTLLADEVHELDTENREKAYDVASGGTLKRQDGLVLLLSTAGQDMGSLFGRLVALGLAGKFPPSRLFVYLHADEAISKLPDPTDEEIAEGIRQANPLAACGAVNVRKLVDKFREMPLYRAKRYYWNLWVAVDESWLPGGAWDACMGPLMVDPSLPTWVGVDMALKRDSASIVALQLRPDGRYQAWAKIWLPDGDLIDQTECDDYLRSLCGSHNVQWIAADEAWWSTLATLETEGLPIFRMPQQGRNMIVGYARTYRLIVTQELVHDGAPDFSDQIASAAPQSSDRGWTLRKGKMKRRIDSAPALAGAVFATTVPVEEPEPELPRSAVY